MRQMQTEYLFHSFQQKREEEMQPYKGFGNIQTDS